MPTQNRCKGNVLISYLIEPFTLPPWKPLSNKHTNYWECSEIAKIFSSRGYNIDIISYKNKKFIPKKDYSFVVDVESNLEYLSPLLDKNCKKIMHVTSAYWKFQNGVEQERLDALFERKGVRLEPRRLLSPSKNVELADYIEGLGGSFANETYSFAGKSIFSIPVSSVCTYDFPENKNWNEIKNNYLWLGGGGAVLKGLDIILETFKQLPNYELYICGPVEAEKDFVDLYRQELYLTKNIHFKNKLDVTSKEFKSILDNVIGVIHISASEGAGAAAIQAMQAGLIPIVTKQSSVPTKNFGMTVKNISVESLTESIKELSDKEASELKELSLMTWKYAHENHTREAFSKSYSDFVDTILHA